MAFIKDLYHDEIRDGYLVKADMKKVWNRQLEMWQEVDRICRKHNITYWAAYGTLLGAARHGGYIPWDEDLDLCMMRPDFNRFFAVLKDELIQSGRVFEIKHTDFSMIKLSHSQTTLMENENSFKQKGVNGILTDVFALDIAADDTQDGFFAFNALNELLGAIFNFPAIIKHIQNGGQTLNDFSILENLANNTSKEEQNELLYRYVTALFNQSSNVSWIADSVRNFYKYPMKKDWFRETIYLPFEMIELPAPKMFDEVLTSYYGDWCTPVCDGQNRMGLIHSADIPWREFLERVDMKKLLPKNFLEASKK